MLQGPNVKMTGDQGQVRAQRADALGRPCRLTSYPRYAMSAPVANRLRNSTPESVTQKVNDIGKFFEKPLLPLT